MKKTLALVCAIAVIAGSCIGCTREKEKGQNEQINLRFSFWEPSTGREMQTALQGIVDKYEEAHQDVNIELVPQAATGYQDWIKTQMTVDDLPEIELNYGVYLISQFKAGVIEDISDALDSPNPYNNDLIWKDTFVDGALDSAHEYQFEPSFNIPLFRTGVAMFYNKSIYDDLGLKAPANWNEFMANCEKIDNAGIVPIAFMGQKGDQLDWLRWELNGGLSLERWLADKELNINGDNYLSNNEIVAAVDSGHLNFETDKELQEDYKNFIEYAKQFLKYSPNGSGLDEAAAKTMYLSGKAAHLCSGSWDIVGLLKNDEINFESSVFPFPHLTTENSVYAGKGISNNCVTPVAITSSVNKQEGARDAAIDFLKFLTSPEQYKTFVNTTYQIASVKDVDADPIFDAFMEEGYPLVHLFGISVPEARSANDVYKSIVTGADVELNDSVFAEMNKAMREWSDSLKETQKWNKENNYNIDNLPMVGGAFQPHN